MKLLKEFEKKHLNDKKNEELVPAGEGWDLVVTAKKSHFKEKFDQKTGEPSWEPSCLYFNNPDNYRMLKYKDRLLIPNGCEGFYYIDLEVTEEKYFKP